MAALRPGYVALENTYIMRPEGYGKNAKFNASDVSSVVQLKIANRLEGVEYEAERAAQLAQELSNSIKDGVRALGLVRYKVLVHVTLGQRAGQAIRLASRGLWDATTDNCVSEMFENETLFCAVQVYGVFVE